MLPGSKSVLIVIFCRGNRLTSVSNASKFDDASHKSVIDKDSSSLRRDMQLDQRGDTWKLCSRILQHDNVHDDFLARFNYHLLSEIRVPRLTHGDFMFAGKEQEFLVVLEFMDVAHVLPIDTYARRFVRLGFAYELHFSQNLALGKGCSRKYQAAENKTEERSVERAKCSHAQPPVRQFSGSRIAWERSALAGNSYASHSNHNSQYPG